MHTVKATIIIDDEEVIKIKKFRRQGVLFFLWFFYCMCFYDYVQLVK